MITNLFDKNIVKVLSFFLISPGSKWLRKEIKEKTEMNNIPLDKTLNKLIRLGLIRKEKNLLMLNPFEPFELNGLKNYIGLEYRELNSLPLKIYYILVEISDKLSEISEIKEVYLFGSYAKLIYHEKSDIDLAIILNNKIKNRVRSEKEINKIIEKMSRKNKRRTEVHFFLEKDMKAKDPLIRDILRGRKLI